MQNESPVVVYLQDVLGIRSFIRSSEEKIVRATFAVEVATPQTTAAAAVPETFGAQRISTIQFVIGQDLSAEEKTLVEKMMGALKVAYELRKHEDARDATTYLLWGAQAKQQFGFNSDENLVWKEKDGARYFLGCELQELLGTSPQVVLKKKQIWTQLQCLKK